MSDSIYDYFWKICTIIVLLFTPIIDLFCGNITVVEMYEQADCEEQGLEGKFNIYLHGKFSKFVSASYEVKVIKPFSLQDKGVKEFGIKLGRKKMDEIATKYKSLVAVPYKIELAGFRVETILYAQPEILNQCQVNLLKGFRYYIRFCWTV